MALPMNIALGDSHLGVCDGGVAQLWDAEGRAVAVVDRMHLH